MAWFPFVFIITGALIGLGKLTNRYIAFIELIGNIALVVLMLTIGINIGARDTVIKSIGVIGMQCVAITFFAYPDVISQRNGLLQYNRRIYDTSIWD